MNKTMRFLKLFSLLLAMSLLATSCAFSEKNEQATTGSDRNGGNGNSRTDRNAHHRG